MFKSMFVDNLELVWCEDHYEIKQYPGWIIKPYDHTLGEKWLIQSPDKKVSGSNIEIENCIKGLRGFMCALVNEIENT